MRYLVAFIILPFLFSCNKEKITTQQQATDSFFVKWYKNGIYKEIVTTPEQYSIDTSDYPNNYPQLFQSGFYASEQIITDVYSNNIDDTDAFDYDFRIMGSTSSATIRDINNLVGIRLYNGFDSSIPWLYFFMDWQSPHDSADYYFHPNSNYYSDSAFYFEITKATLLKKQYGKNLMAIEGTFNQKFAIFRTNITTGITDTIPRRIEKYENGIFRIPLVAEN